MSSIAVLSGSPSAESRTLLLAREVGARLRQRGHQVVVLDVRALPADDLLGARVDAAPIRAAVGVIEQADAVVVATPVYKAAYSGALKVFLDLLPQFGLRGKTVLPLATGGTLAHVLAIDYALRPVLAALGARHVVNGLFLLDKQLERTATGGLRLDAQAEERLAPILDDLLDGVRTG